MDSPRSVLTLASTPLFADLGLPHLLGGVVLVVVLILGIARFRNVRARRRIATDFDSFKERVIGLREQVESLSARHAKVPQGESYRESMVGSTRAVYEQLQGEFGRLNEVWRQRMELWEKVSSLVVSEGPLGAGRLNEAGRLLKTLGAFEEVDAACQSCVKQLDRLEGGHAEAARRFTQTAEAATSLRPQIASVGNLGLPTTPYEEELDRSVAIAEQARPMQSSDPIGACDALILAEDKMTALRTLLGEVTRLHQQYQDAGRERERVVEEVATRRAGGLRLCETDGNPDPCLERAETARADALASLQAANTCEAESFLAAASGETRQAKEIMERQAAAQAQCQRDLPARRAAAQQLAHSLEEARTQRAELERNFAPESWRGLGDVIPRAQELMASAATLQEEAAAAAADHRQHYFRALDLLNQVKNQHGAILDIYRILGDTLRHLNDLRRECTRRANEIGEHARQVDGLFSTHARAVRARSRARRETAGDFWNRARREMQEGRPDWRAIESHLEETRRGLHDAENLAREDIRLSDRAVAALADSERELDRVLSDPSASGRADLSHATTLLGQARARLASQEYEQVIDQAGAAQKEARRTHEQVQRLIQQEEQQRQQAHMAALAAAAAMQASAPSPQPLSSAGDMGSPSSDAGAPSWEPPPAPTWDPPPDPVAPTPDPPMDTTPPAWDPPADPMSSKTE